MTSRSTLLVGFLLVLAGVVGCDDKKSKEADNATTASTNADAGADAGPEIVYADGPRPTDNTVIATAGDVEITWKDYQHGVRVGRLFAPSTPDGGTEEYPPGTLATPNLQTMMVRSLLSRRTVLKEAEERGIELPEDDVKELLQNDERMGRWAKHWDEPDKMAEKLGEIDVTVDDFKRIGREQLAQERLRDALVAEIDADELWPAYQYENNTVRMLAASVLNVPSSDELTAFVDTRGDEIETYFKENQQRYTYPARAEATVIVGEKADSASREKLEKAAADLSASDANPEEIAKKHGLYAKKRELFTRSEDAEIYAAKLGQTGVTFESPRGSYAWRKTADVPPTVRELSYGLKREIAASILQKEAVSAEAAEKLAVAREKFESLDIPFQDIFEELDRDEVEAVLEELREMGMDAKITPDFPRAQNGFIPGFGINENVAIAVFNATEKNPYPPEPIISRDRAFTFRLIGRSEPSKVDFGKEKEIFAETYRQKVKQGVVDRFLESSFKETGLNIDLKPVHVVYGQLQKPQR